MQYCQTVNTQRAQAQQNRICELNKTVVVLLTRKQTVVLVAVLVQDIIQAKRK
jgi:hypothetical protein